ncbi:MAG: hypothetical protein FWD57_03505, partial [Polyangiaceae bacterium]|nr:hypothetical protein [Polyangiaceae bacterium]
MASFGLKLPPIESAKDSAEGAVSADGAKRAAVPASLGRLVEVGQVLVPGIYAWAVTVVPAAYDSSHPVLAWIAACSACVFLCVGAFVVRARSSLGHALGIWAFLIACTATWLLSTSSLQIDRLDPWRAGAGSIGWILFALGWGTPWRVRQHPDDDPRALLEP